MNKPLVVLAALSAALILASCSAKPADVTNENEGLIIVGFSQIGAESDWRTANTKSMRETFTAENGYKLIFNDARQKQENQITAIRNFIQQEVDYIVLAPVTEKGWDTVLQEAKDAKIPVIIVDRMLDVSDKSLFTAWVGSDFRKEGEIAAKWLRDNSIAPLNIVHLQGTIGSTPQIGRTAAIVDAAAENNWNLVAIETGEFTEAKAKEVMTEILKNQTDIDAVYCENDNMAFGAIAALENIGVTVGADVKIVSFDATVQGLQMVLDGKINFNVECNPLHGPRVAAIIEALEDGEPSEKFSYVSETSFDSKTLTKEMLSLRQY